MVGQPRRILIWPHEEPGKVERERQLADYNGRWLVLLLSTRFHLCLSPELTAFSESYEDFRYGADIIVFLLPTRHFLIARGSTRHATRVVWQI